MPGIGIGIGMMFTRNTRRWLRTLMSSLPNNMSFTRSSSVTVPDNLGVLQTVGNNVPAFEGLRLSYLLSDGATLGPELAVGIPTFQGTGVSGTWGAIVMAGTTSPDPVYGSLISLGKTYQLFQTISGLTAGGSITLRLGSAGLNKLPPKSVNGTTTAVLTNTGDGVLVSDAAVGTIANVSNSIKEIIPVWLPTAIDGITPLTSQGMLNEPGATNLALWSQDFTTSAWAKVGSGSTIPTITPGQLAPDGSLTAHKVDFGATTATDQYSMLSSASQVAGTYTDSIWLRAASPVVLYIAEAGTPQVNTACNVTTVWQRFSVSGISSIITYFNIGPDTRIGKGQPNVQAAVSVFMWGAQLELGPVASSYIPTTTVAVTRAPSNFMITSPALPASGAWVAEVKFRSKVNSAQITTPMAWGGSYFDANNYIKGWVNSVIAYLEINKAGVKEYVTIPCVLIAGQDYSFLVRRNADGTFDLFLNQVKSLSGLGVELITIAPDRDFSAPGNWEGAGVSVSGGVLNINQASQGGGTLYLVLPRGVPTRIGFDIVSYVSGGISPWFFATATPLRSAIGSYYADGVNNIDDTLRMYAETQFTGAIDNVSRKQINNSTTATQPVHGALWSVGNDGQGAKQFFGSIISDGAKAGAFSDAQCITLTA